MEQVIQYDSKNVIDHDMLRLESECIGKIMDWVQFDIGTPMNRVEPGGIALIKRGAEIRDGDVGLFFAGGDMVLRQYCEDWAGNVYLFAVNRRRSGLDIRLPAAGGAPVMSLPSARAAAVKRPIRRITTPSTAC